MTRDKHKLLKETTVLLFATVIVFCAFGAHAENIDPDGTGCKYAWAENVGWINFKPLQGLGVTVTSTGLTGYAWGENIGWINLSPTGGGVVNDGVGNLSGYAWGENVGWINFGPGNGGVKIDPFTGLFSGSAWGENIGWINFSIAQDRIKTSFIAFNTPSGSNITVSPPGSGTTITFSIVNSPGNTSVTTSSSGPAPPAGFQLGTPPTYYDMSTTATYTPPVIVCITYTAQYSNPSSLRLLHYESGTWVDITTSNNTTTHTICGQANSLSPFVIAQSANQPPVAVCQNVTVAAGPNCTANASINNGSYDPDSDPITVAQSPAGPYPKGNTSVTLTVSDNKGASSQCTATVTVVDTTPPSITSYPVNIVTSTDPGKCSAVVTYNVTAADNCPGVIVASTPLSGSIFPKGTTTVNITATDAAGNTTTGSFTITVVDNQPPTIAAPPPVTVPTGSAATSCGAVCSDATLGTPTSSDNCPGVTVNRTGVPSGSLFPVGTTIITYTAKDAAGNVAAATQTVTVIDNTPPTISGASASPSTLWPPNHKMVDVTINYTATDNCGQTTCNINSVTCNEPISSSDYAIVDAHHIKLSADRLGSGNGRIYTITITCTDSKGNSSSQAVTVTVPHDQGKK